jgi:hypothetical protein
MASDHSCRRPLKLAPEACRKEGKVQTPSVQVLVKKAKTSASQSGSKSGLRVWVDLMLLCALFGPAREIQMARVCCIPQFSLGASLSARLCFASV